MSAALKLLGLAAGVGAAARIVAHRSNGVGNTFAGKVIFITGGSRGLGIALARQFARQGAKLALCSRSEEELRAAKTDLASLTRDVLTLPCDVASAARVQETVAAVIDRFGRLDVLINNAGIITVGPVQSMTPDDFTKAMDTMFWGTVNTTLAALPHLEEARGTVTNVTSIGGKVSVPHLIPYCCAKFAAVAFSEGLRAELRGTGVKVVTIAPGLMRTGSYRNAHFKGDAEAEAGWFGVGASLPGLAMSANRAARQIIAATARGRGDTVLGVPAKALARFHALWPAAAVDMLGLMNGFLPRGRQQHAVNWDAAICMSPRIETMTMMGSKAAREYLQPGAAA
jgi:NAD(P)-dependent dehydrogenase (short-subunit alcohol dehydrogenase family)